MKAFLKSICKIPDFFCSFSKETLVACTMPSVPPLTATPNCFVLNRSAASEFASRAMHLAIRRRMTSPTTIRRTPPFNFFNAFSVALHNIGATNSGN